MADVMDGAALQAEVPPIKQAAAPPARQAGALALLQQGRFRTLWLAQTVSWLGDHFGFLALMIVVNDYTRSAGAVALVMITVTLPRLLFGLPAGVLVDRWDRQRVMVAADGLRAVLTLGIIALLATGQIWLMYPLVFLTSALGVFFLPARNAVMKTILTKEELLPANILMQTTFALTLALGPALAGLMIGRWGAGVSFGFDALTFAVSSVLVATMLIPRSAADNGGGAQSSFGREFREGLRFVAASRTISGLLIVLTAVSLGLGAVNALFVPLLINVLGAGATQLGLVDSAQGAGMIVGGIAATAVASRLKANHLISSGLAIIGMMVIGVGLAPDYRVVMGMALIVGLVISPLEGAIPALMQKVVPLDKMGRVGGAMNTSQSVASLASMGIGGIMADIAGPRAVFVGVGLVVLAAALLAIWAIREE